MIKEQITENIQEILKGLGLASVDFVVEHPGDVQNGDYSSNVAMVVAKEIGKNPRELAESIVQGLQASFGEEMQEIVVAGPGFINFYLSHRFFEQSVRDVINQGEHYGLLSRLQNQKTIIEFTDPNPFKKFHIGHMMSNTIGEALCRITERNGAEVKRMIYQGDVGLHVAKAVWGMVQHRSAFPHDEDSLDDKVRFMSNAYAFGAHEYDGDARAKKEIEVTNKMIYEKSNHEILIYYEKGRQWSLEAFEKIYARLGTAFDFQVLESEVATHGKETVLDGLKRGIFEESEGAIVYRGEKHGLHTRVFVNSQGLPIYEAKELALATVKADMYPYDKSIVITANEQTEYFKVVLAAMREVFPELREKTTHISHGFLRLPSGKMSSRTGDVIAAEDLLDDVKARVLEKMADREVGAEEREVIADQVAVGALKFSILKQSPGRDIIFDFDKSLSFEGDSGPYLQYTATRTRSILRVAEDRGIVSQAIQPTGWEITQIERLLNRFPEVVASAYDELAPQHLVTYLTELSSAFNSFYGTHQIIKEDDETSGYKVALTESVHITIVNGLRTLGIPIPAQM